VPRNRREVQVWRRLGQPAKKILEVGFVTGSLAAEDVRVDKNVDHAAASR
jgi:hypothetical protein